MYKDYEIRKVGDIQYLPIEENQLEAKTEKIEEEYEKEQKKNKKLNKLMKNLQIGMKV